MAKSSTTTGVATNTKLLLQFDDLHRYLYERTCVRPIDPNELKTKGSQYQQRLCSCCENCHKETTKLDIPKPQAPEQLSRALVSFPGEVQLCTSGIPGIVYGVCARRHIPIGTWIGPYEGKKVTADGVLPGKGNSFMWEIYREGELVFYLDGSDEEFSSWMRFIRCARSKKEQNLYAFQYLGHIYYRAFQDISPGTELLVWYDDTYPQYMGIPLEMPDLETMESDDPNANITITTDKGMLVCSKSLSPVSLVTASPIETTRDTTLLTNSVASWRQQKQLESSLTQPRVDKETEPPAKKTRNISQISFATSTATTVELQTLPNYASQNVFTARYGSEEDLSIDEGHQLPFEDPGSSIFRCGQCGKAFAQKSVLQVHVCSRMPNKPYQCGFCGTAFANPNDLRAHAVAHCSEKPFKCGFCSRAFSGATTLNNHIRTHTGEKPFNCEKCGKMFSQGSQLSRHQRNSGDCSD